MSMKIKGGLGKLIVLLAVLMIVFPYLPTSRAGAVMNPSVWWPVNGAHVSGLQPVKALIDHQDINTYQMFWSVDNGSWTQMHTDTTDWPHKENYIDYTNWNWKGSGPYVLNFIATDNYGNKISQTNVTIYVDHPTQTVTPVPVVDPTSNPETSPENVLPVPVPMPAPETPPQDVPAAPVATPTPDTPSVPAPAAPITSGPVVPNKLYIDPTSPALVQAKEWQASQPKDAAVMQKIGNQSTGVWLGGWNADIEADVSKVMKDAQSQNAIPTLVVYNVPGRDCGSYSAGGASNSAEYLEWISKLSSGLGKGEAILILEPDGLANIDCMTAQQQDDRFNMLNTTLSILKSNNPGTKVYVDAGHANWIDVNTMASRLIKAGINNAVGFALNVSNFVDTNHNTVYGQALSERVGGAHFVIDTSRNGVGSDGNWCNPSGRALGSQPTLTTGVKNLDAFLWIKRPGESDGNCNGGPSAGVWWPSYALGLASKAGY